MHKYKVYVTDHTFYTVEASSQASAKEKVWDEIKDGFTYWYNSKKDFMKSGRVVVVQVD